ncbi:STE20-related kinase adapter protein alpha isoform 3-T8 [Alca torda]
MSNFLPDSSCYELLTIIGRGFEDLMVVNLARYKPTGEYVTVRRVNLEACTNEMVTFLQGELHVSKLFNHPNIVPYKATFIADNELWVVTSFMAYGSAKDLICTHFMDGMSELAIAYILQGVLKALDYIHHMGYVHRSVKASHILISVDGKVYLSGLRSNLSMINHGQRLKVVHDFPKYSIKVLPWLSPEVLQQNLQGYDAKSDIYSVGITACELANGHVPFKDMPSTQMLLEKLNGTVPCLLDTTTIPADELTMKTSRSSANYGMGETMAISNVRAANGEPTLHPYLRTFSTYFHNFVEQCLQRNPDFRPSAGMLLNHPFFKQLCGRLASSSPGVGKGRGSPAPGMICLSRGLGWCFTEGEYQDHYGTQELLERLYAEHFLVTTCSATALHLSLCRSSAVLLKHSLNFCALSPQSPILKERGPRIPVAFLGWCQTWNSWMWMTGNSRKTGTLPGSGAAFWTL